MDLFPYRFFLQSLDLLQMVRPVFRRLVNVQRRARPRVPYLACASFTSASAIFSQTAWEVRSDRHFACSPRDAEGHRIMPREFPAENLDFLRYAK